MEQNFMDGFKATLSNLVTEVDNMETDEINQNTRTNFANSQDINPFVLPVVHLFKTNSEGHRAQFDILPEDFSPKSSRLPYPFMGTLGIEHLDPEATGEMHLQTP